MENLLLVIVPLFVVLLNLIVLFVTIKVFQKRTEDLQLTHQREVGELKIKHREVVAKLDKNFNDALFMLEANRDGVRVLFDGHKQVPVVQIPVRRVDSFDPMRHSPSHYSEWEVQHKIYKHQKFDGRVHLDRRQMGRIDQCEINKLVGIEIGRWMQENHFVKSQYIPHLNIVEYYFDYLE